MKALFRRAACASLLMLYMTSVEAAQTIFHFTSEPGDYIGQGQELTLTPDDANFNVSRNSSNGVYVDINNFSLPDAPIPIFWYVNFSAPNNAELMPGAYEDATRFPFNDASMPGLSIEGDGRGCNMLTGRFDVLEAIYDSNNGDVISFAADFEQHCEESPPALFGSIRINSDVPLPVLLPPRINIDTPINGQGCVEATSPAGATVELSASVPVAGDFEFSWSTSTGEVATGPTFSVLLGVDVSAEVNLTATERSSNEQVTATSQVCVTDTTAPQIRILSPKDGQVLSGRKPPLLNLKIDDAVDQDFDQIHVFVGQVADIPIKSRNGWIQTALPPAKTGPDGTMTEITVEATDDSGNTGRASVNIVLRQSVGHRKRARYQDDDS